MDTFIFKCFIVCFFVLVLFIMQAIFKRMVRSFSSIKKKEKSSEKTKKEHSLLFGVLEFLFELVDAFLF